jgi:Ca2+-binding RTX toxin-like protein
MSTIITPKGRIVISHPNGNVTVIAKDGTIIHATPKKNGIEIGKWDGSRITKGDIYEGQESIIIKIEQGSKSGQIKINPDGSYEAEYKTKSGRTQYQRGNLPPVKLNFPPLPLPDDVRKKLEDAVTFAPRDPLALDLDNDGIETVAISATAPILFDHNGDGAPSATGWLKGDDGWLVNDLDGDGKITSGKELLGVDTDITVGGVSRKATTGFEALRALDTHQEGDGKNLFDSRDAAFSQLRVWQDKNQNGVTDAGELSTLSALGIVSIQLQETAINQDLGGGNSITGKAKVTRRVDSSTSESEIDSVLVSSDSAANLNLAENPFYTDLPDLPVNDTAQVLPDMQGSGLVYGLRQAMSLGNTASNALTSTVQAFAAAATRDAQIALIDKLITEWGATSKLTTSGNPATGTWLAKSTTPNPALSATTQQRIKTFAEQNPEMYRKVIVLEQFNGQMGLAALMSRWNITLPTAVTNSLNAAYTALREAVYGALVIETRLKPYLDAIELVVDDQGLRFDLTKLSALIASTQSSDISKAITDVLELSQLTGSTMFTIGFDGASTMRSLLASAPSNLPLLSQLPTLGLFQAGATTGTSKNDMYLGDQGNNSFKGGDGSDLLSGGSGNDTLYGEVGDDTLEGGLGNDNLRGGSGADVYLFGKGDGQDTIFSSDTNGTGPSADAIVFKTGISPADILLTRSNSSLLIRINGSTDSLTVSSYFNADASTGYAIEALRFADGTEWDIPTVKARVLQSTAGNDTLTGYASHDSISGGAGNDTLYGDDGNDTLDGGGGNDYLAGERGDDVYLFGRGSGQDTISNGSDEAAGSSPDAIFLGAGIVPADLTLSHSGDDLIIRINGTSDSLLVTRYFDSDGTTSSMVDSIKFTDGTVWNYANVKAKAMVPTTGDDRLHGYAANDTINSGAGNDTVYGYAGNDVLEGGTGTDYLHGGDGNDSLQGNEHLDSLYGEAGADTLKGGTGTDILYGGDGDDSLQGNEDNDYLRGDNGNDTLEGGSGNDDLRGGLGADVYLFGKGAGQDTLHNEDTDAVGTNPDTILLGTGISTADISLSKSNNDLIIGINGTSDRLVVKEYFYNDGVSKHVVENLKFASGTTWDVKTVLNKFTISTDGPDALYGTPDADVVDGKAGNDTIYAGLGSDTYKFGKGDGRDVIASSDDPAVGKIDTLLFKPGVAPSEVSFGTAPDPSWWRQQGGGNALVIKIAGTTDQVLIQDFLNNGDPANTRNPLQQIKFDDGTTWGISTILSKLYAGTNAADIIDGTSKGELITGGAGNDSLYGNDGRDTLDGGAGNDYIHEGSDDGNDTFLFGKGDGQDTIDGSQDSEPDEVNTLLFKPGVAPSEVTLGTSYSSLIIKLANSTDQIVARNFLYDGYTNTSYAFQQVKFADGTTWNTAAILSKLYAGTESADRLDGTNRAETINGQGGDDSLFGGYGGDTLDGGVGNDYINGGRGGNTYLFGRGDGQDTIDETTDARDSLGGDDTLLFRSGIAPGEVSLASSGTSLIIKITGTNDQITVKGFFAQNTPDNVSNPLQQIKFADGSIWDISAILSRLPSGTASDDALYGSASGDAMNGLAGKDSLYGNGGSDTLDGGVDNDLIYGGLGNDVMQGGTGNDTLYGEAGADTLDSGVGNDYISGGLGSDTYLFGKGDGQDTIAAVNDSTAGKFDTLSFKSGVVPADITFERSGTYGSSLAIKVAGSADQLTVENFLSADDPANSYNPLQQIKFADGTIWDVAAILKKMYTGTDSAESLKGTINADVINGFGGSDRLYGQGGEDTLDGGGGTDSIYGGAGNDVMRGGADNDRMEGDAGNDTYVFSLGDGADTIFDFDSSPGNVDVISFTNVRSTDITSVTRSTYDVTLSYGATDSITISTFFYYTGGPAKIEHITFADGITWSLPAIEAITAAGLTKLSAGGAAWTGQNTAEFVFGSTASDSVSGLGGDDWLYGAAGNDVLQGGEGMDSLIGGIGQDVLYGGAGTDTYVYNKGDGYDVIYGQRAEDTLIMKGFKSTDVTFNRTFSDINIAQTSSGTSYNILTLVRQAFDSTHEFTGVSQIVFDDKTITADEVRKLALQGSSGNDTNLRGYVTDDTIYGKDGNDSLFGESGSDKLYGGAGLDLLDGGTGNDYLGGGIGNDTYRFSRGGGQDSIVDIDATVGNVDVLQFQAGITHDQLWFSQSGNNLKISVIGTSDQVTIAGGAGGSNFRIEQLTAGGKTLSDTQVSNLVQAMASMTPPAMGQTTLTDAQRAQLAPVLAANWS